MKYYQSKNVYEAALERIEYLYNEFPNVEVSISGGKDSTALMHLCIEVARKLNRLPVRAYWLDQEAEWRQTVEYMRLVQAMPEVAFSWYQIPFDIFNASSHDDDMLHCWREGDEWIRPKEANSIKENTYGVNRFHKFLDGYLGFLYPDEKACQLGGVRADESYVRFLAVSSATSYKHITYGAYLYSSPKHFLFYPIYDWRVDDVWHYISSNNLLYNKIYDAFFQYGIHPRAMRVSNLTHEVAVKNLMTVQDLEQDTWDSIVSRLDSANSIKHLQRAAITCPRELPFMFSTWREYRDFLLEKMITDEKVRNKMSRKFANCDKKFVGTRYETGIYMTEIETIIRNDHYFTMLNDKLAICRNKNTKS